jgi:hypothetical protein
MKNNIQPSMTAAENFVNGLGLVINKIQDFDFAKMWEVKNHKEVYTIFATLQDLRTESVKVSFLKNY